MRHVIAFYTLYLIFWVGEIVYTHILRPLSVSTFRRDQLREWCWLHMRLQLFVIRGACQHSGNCCRSLMLIQSGKSVDTMSAYVALVQREPLYARFQPEVGIQDRVHRFRCSCLTEQNLCNDYDNRPKICQQYPMSMFVKLGYIHAGCGYRVQFRGFYPRVRHPVFWSWLFRMMRENRLSHDTLRGLRNKGFAKA